MQNVNEKMYICVDTNAHSIIVTIQDYHVHYKAVANRDGRIKFITKIKKQDIVVINESNC